MPSNTIRQGGIVAADTARAAARNGQYREDGIGLATLLKQGTEQ